MGINERHNALGQALTVMRKELEAVERMLVAANERGDALRRRAVRAERLALGLLAGMVIAFAVLALSSCGATQAPKAYMPRPPARVLHMGLYERWHERRGERITYKCLDGFALCQTWGSEPACMCVPDGTPAILTPRGTWR